MKKIFFKSISVITVSILLTSCSGLHTGYMSSSAALSSGNFIYAKQNVRGSATASYFLGLIGGMEKETLVDDAKQKLLADNPLKDGQALANLTVNFKTSFYFGMIFRKVTCTVTADVVEFK